MTTGKSNIADAKAAKAQVSILLLPDRPTAVDAFGPHQQLADAIAQLIDSQVGGKAIALEGGWGSGKSSIVEMLKSQLEGNISGPADTRVLVFDAWSHEGDPLRRVFLEELTRFCTQHETNEVKGVWQLRQKKEITGRTRETDQETTPVLRSPLPLGCLAVLAIFPIAVALLSGLARHNLDDSFIWTSLVVALIFALLVPVLLLGLGLYCCIWPIFPFTIWPLKLFKFVSSPPSRSERLKQAGRLISLYAKQIDETSNTTAHETFGPTSIEFQRYFSDLMASHLKDTKRKLIIVLDNLDRVPATIARTLWTTLRVFAECCENDCNSIWSTRVWFLVPYDPSAARRLWGDGEEEDKVDNAWGVSQKKGEIVEKANTDASQPVQPVAPHLSSALLDKTFQVRFDVPPLLLADWKAFLGDQLKKAIPSDTALDSAAVHRIYLLSRRMAELKLRPPTPRHLTLYINDIAALHRRFQGAFPVDHLALYSILRRQGHDVRLWLLEPQKSQAMFLSIFEGTDVVASLCAMAHGTTDKEKARDLHLRTPIESALGSGNAEELRKLSSAVGFWQVLEIICDDNATAFGTDESRVANALSAVEKSNLISGTQQECYALRRFLSQLVSVADWKGLDSHTGEAAACVIRLNLSKLSIISMLQRLASVSEAKDMDNLKVNEWIAGMVHISAALRTSGRIQEFNGSTKLVAVDKTTEVLVAIAGLERNERVQVVQLIFLCGEVMEFVSSLLPPASTEWPDNHAQAIRTLFLLPSAQVDLKAVLESTCARMKVDAELTKRELDQLVGALADLEELRQSGLKDAVETVVLDGTIFRRIKNCAKALEGETAGHLFRWAIRTYDFGTAPASPAGAAQGFELAKQIGAKPQEYAVIVDGLIAHLEENDENDLLDSLLSQFKHIAPLVIDVFKRLQNGSQLGKVMHAPLFVVRFAEVLAICESGELLKIDELSSALLKDSPFEQSLREVQVAEATLGGVIKLIQNGALSRSAEFGTATDAFLKSRNSEQWLQSLRSDDDALLLVIARRAADNSFELSGPFVEAFEQFLTDVLDKTHSVANPTHGWNEIRNAIASHRQETIAATLIELADKPSKDLEAVIKLFGDRLKHAAIAYKEESFVRLAFLPLVKSKASQTLDWMAGVVENHPRFWPQTSQSDRETFSQELVVAFGQANDEQKSFLQRIANGLSIELDQDQDED